jgi:diacylglycerol kinase
MKHNKFQVAGRGLWLAITQENSFWVHIPAACGVFVAATYFRVSRVECLLLALCVLFVFATEVINTALERLAKSITLEQNPYVRDALDIAAGAVLLVSLGASVIGSVIFWPYLQQLFL